MQIYILFQNTKTPAGGGNQFLRALDKVLESKGISAGSIEESDFILINSHHFIHSAAIARWRFPQKIFVHRIDGPMRLYNSWSDRRDHMVNLAATRISDGTIFQSEWSREENYRLGLFRNNFDVVIHNSVDPEIFNRKGKDPFSVSRKVRLVATNWSPNPRKGFDVYDWLDQNLDFSKFEMTFVGNSPIRFRNINHVKPLTSKKLADVLKRHDIYIFGSRVEACSNALLEALHCGLPSIAYNFSSNPEIIGRGGELFDRPEDIPDILKKIISGYSDYQERISLPSIEGVANEYVDFMKGIYNSVLKGDYATKSLSTAGLIKIFFRLFAWKFKGKVSSIN